MWFHHFAATQVRNKPPFSLLSVGRSGLACSWPFVNYSLSTLVSFHSSECSVCSDSSSLIAAIPSISAFAICPSLSCRGCQLSEHVLCSLGGRESLEALCFPSSVLMPLQQNSFAIAVWRWVSAREGQRPWALVGIGLWIENETNIGDSRTDRGKVLHM